MKSLLKRLAVLALVATLPAIAQDTEKLRLNDQLLKADDTLVPFNTSDAFKLILAGYKLELKELKLDKTRSENEKEQRRKKIEENVSQILMLHEYVINVAPVAFAVTIQSGAEIPVPMSRKLIRMGVAGGQISGGVTLAATKHRGTDGLAGFSVGVSMVSGANVLFTPRTPDQAPKRAGSTGIQWLTLAVGIIVPTSEDVPSLRVGDLQGMYFGGGLEVSTDLGSYAQTPGTIAAGLYAKPNSSRVFGWPSAAMLFAYVAKGANDHPLAVQAEGLAYTTFWGSDGTTPRMPIPGLSNYSTSKHSPVHREQAFRQSLPADLLDSVLRTQEAMKAADREIEASKK